MLGDDDLDTFLAEFGVPVTGATVVAEAKGIVEDVEQLLLPGEHGVASAGERVGVLMRTDRVPSLTVGDVIVVDGENLEVRERLRIHEGKFTQLFCREL